MPELFLHSYVSRSVVVFGFLCTLGDVLIDLVASHEFTSKTTRGFTAEAPLLRISLFAWDFE